MWFDENCGFICTSHHSMEHLLVLGQWGGMSLSHKPAASLLFGGFYLERLVWMNPPQVKAIQGTCNPRSQGIAYTHTLVAQRAQTWVQHQPTHGPFNHCYGYSHRVNGPVLGGYWRRGFWKWDDSIWVQRMSSRMLLPSSTSCFCLVRFPFTRSLHALHANELASLHGTPSHCQCDVYEDYKDSMIFIFCFVLSLI